MELKNCASCGKMFSYIGGPPVCQACQKKMDEKFSDVKQYVYDHPGCGIQDVCEDMEVTQAQVKKWIREERLTFAESSDLALNCEKCGRRILTGRFCKECKASMINDMGGLYKKPEPVKVEKPKSENKMRFIDN
ncbi:MAG: flagellar protein [Lachnospiraceae bacterium]|nr:flagellar protein [Lachnospiraceae bacterium]